MSGTGPAAAAGSAADSAAGSGTVRAPVGGSAPVAARILAQARFDVGEMLRNGEQVLLTLVLPLLVLVGLSRTTLVDLGAGPRIDVAAPGVLALAVISTSFTGQAIGTGFDRRAGLLRLLGTTPLGRGGLLAGRVVAVLAVQGVQVVVIGGAALLLGWRPVAAGVLPAAVAFALGTAAFVALGLLLAGTLRAEAVLAAANLVWVLLLAGGGVVLPAERLGAVAGVVALLPSAALGDAVRVALGAGAWPWTDLALLAAWGTAAAVACARWFRWD